MWFLILTLFMAPAAAYAPPSFDPYFVAAGRQFSFVVSDGLAWASGRNEFGQLSLEQADHQDQFAEVDVDENGDVKEIAVGAFHSLFLMNSGAVYAAGRNHKGQLGDGSVRDRHRAVRLDLKEENDTATVEALAAGYAHSLFLMSDGTVRAAGLNLHGQLGDGTDEERHTPKTIYSDPTDNASKIAAGYDFSYILTTRGSVWATGNNLGGQLGAGPRRIYRSFTKILENVIEMAAGESHGLFVTRDHRVFATGANFDGQLGDGTYLRKSRPVNTDVNEAKFVAAGGDSSCVVIGSTRELNCFGSNRDGQLGLGLVSRFSRPEQVPVVHDSLENVAIGDTHSLFLAHPGDVFIAGTNSFGELGDNRTENRLQPEILRRLPFPVTTRTTTNTTTTTMAPTPAPVPAPTPGPTPVPTTQEPTVVPTTEPTRSPENVRNSWLIYPAGVLVSIVLVGLLVLLAHRQSLIEEGGRNTELVTSRSTSV